jgi:hypothetical protein
MHTDDARALLESYAHAEEGVRSLFGQVAQAGCPLRRVALLRGAWPNADGVWVPHTGARAILNTHTIASAHAQLAWAAMEADVQAALHTCIDPFLVLFQKLLPVVNGPLAACSFSWVDRPDTAPLGPEAMLRVNGTWIHNPARVDNVPIASIGRILCFVEQTAHLDRATTLHHNILPDGPIAAATSFEARVLAHAANPNIPLQAPIEF